MVDDVRRDNFPPSYLNPKMQMSSRRNKPREWNGHAILNGDSRE